MADVTENASSWYGSSTPAERGGKVPTAAPAPADAPVREPGATTHAPWAQAMSDADVEELYASWGIDLPALRAEQIAELDEQERVTSLRSRSVTELVAAWRDNPGDRAIHAELKRRREERQSNDALKQRFAKEMRDYRYAEREARLAARGLHASAPRRF